MTYTYEYPRPALTVDCVVFGFKAECDLQLLLIERAHEPFANCWALPGGFVDIYEDIETAAHRELEEETGVKNVFIEQLYTFGAPQRDPRGRVVSVAYYALINLDTHTVTAASDAKQAEWFSVSELPQMAFDHSEIVQMAIHRLQSKLRYQPIGFELLPEQFSLSGLQMLYETILQKTLNKRNFRSKILKMNILKQVGSQENVSHRPASLFSFDKNKYDELVKIGFIFEI